VWLVGPQVPTADFEMVLLSCVQLDARTFTLTVRESWTDRRWLRRVRREQVKTYDLAVRVGRWLDGDSYVLKPDPRHFRLCELFAAWRVDQKLNAGVGLPSNDPLLGGE